MELRSLVSDIKAKVRAQREYLSKPVVGKQDANFERDLEAQKTFNEIDALVTELESFDQAQEATSNHVKIITDFLAKRWDRIKNTDLIYPIDSESAVSTLCIYIAKYLELHKELVTQPNYLAMLMPSIQSWHNLSSHTNLATLFLHAFLPNDQNTMCFQVGYLDLNMDELTNTRLEMSMMVGGERVKLSPAECDRVYHHSPVVSDYYDVMKSVYQRQQEMIRAKQSSQEINAFMRSKQEAIHVARENLIIAQRDERYGKRTVRSSYGREGRELLINNLLNDVNHTFNTRDEIFTFMSSCLKPCQWQGFLAKMQDNTKFIALMMQGASIDDVGRLKAMFGADHAYNKAVAFALVEVYARIRLEEGEYSSLLGWVGSFVKHVFPKEIKEKVVNILRNYLAGDSVTHVDCQKYFFADDMTADKRKQFSDDEINLLNAMKNSRVGNIYACICELLLPAMAKDEKSNFALANINGR